MGKTKAKYPVNIKLDFCLITTDNSFIEKEVQIKVTTSPLKYEHLKQPFKYFLMDNNIHYQAYMFISSQTDSYELIDDSFNIQIPELFELYGDTLLIIVKSYVALIKQQVDTELQNIHSELTDLNNKISQISSKQEIETLKNNNSLTSPTLVHLQSTNYNNFIEQPQIDIAVLFSEPIFDENRKKVATSPVDFRQEIQRLNIALKSSLKKYISLKCQIGTKENLKYLIKLAQPKILHIICHGTKEGSLEFQDDSRTVLGTLQMMKTQDTKQVLKAVQDKLPKVVFINSCYSEHVGQIFYDFGVKYVIMIDSEDKIQDQAAQIFSQHFYRNIFNGQKVGQAFKSAKNRVKLKHNSLGCCCRHSSKQRHRQNCRWIQVIKKKQFGQIEGHKLFHIPSQHCKCQMRNHNRHKIDCQWARQSLFQINNDFRILTTQGKYRFPRTKSQLPSYLPFKGQLTICCCFNYITNQSQVLHRIPHSECNKFKMLPDPQKQQTQGLYQIVPSPIRSQISDYTSSELIEIYEKNDHNLIGRQKQLFDFMKKINELHQNIFIIYGQPGVGRTSFCKKTASYLIERRAYEIYFYIDLYQVRDKDIFRHKFNEISKFNYNGQIKLLEVKNKLIILILDNIDQFFLKEKQEFYQELENLRTELPKSKILLTFKQDTCQFFEVIKLHVEKIYLSPLNNTTATRLLYQKLRHQFDISVQHSDIFGLILNRAQLKIPKVIESISHSFSNSNQKITINDIQKKLNQIGEGDYAVYRLIQENLNQLKLKSKQSYDLLMFISQFSTGISQDDFQVLSMYDKKQSNIQIPIDKNWEIHFYKLFQKIQICKQNSQQQLQNQQNIPTMKNNYSNIQNFAPSTPNMFTKQSSKQQDIIKGQSYFMEQVDTNRFVVKRFIRDFIWNRHKSDSNCYMKHLFIAYMAVMLQVYFKWLTDEYYVHEELLEFSNISSAGLFSDRRNMMNNSVNMTQSLKFAKDYNIEFQKLIEQNPNIKQKIRKSDPSVFILNHKQDLLNVFEYDWDMVDNYLQENKKKQHKIFIRYLQNLTLHIPTAFKIAKVQKTLMKYAISKSANLLTRMKNCPNPQRRLSIMLKLKLMRASLEVEGQQTSIQSYFTFNKDVSPQIMQKVNDKYIEEIKSQWFFNCQYLLMYKTYISMHESSNRTQKGKSTNEKLKLVMDKLKEWTSENWKKCQPFLQAKHSLLLSLIYLKFLKNCHHFSLHTSVIKFKKQFKKEMLKLAENSSHYLLQRNIPLLSLRSMLVAIDLFWQQSQKKKKQQLDTDSYTELVYWQQKLEQANEIFNKRKYNLAGITQLDAKLKMLAKEMKAVLWQISQNTIILMRSVPLSNIDYPIIGNLIRRKNQYRRQIEEAINKKIDVCTKFEILTAKKLQQETKNACTILILSTDFKKRNNKIYMVVQGPVMNEQLIEVDELFIHRYNFENIKILILSGENTHLGIKILNQLLNDPPIMIALSTNFTQEDLQQWGQFNQFQLDQHQDTLGNYLENLEKFRKIQVNYIKQFIQKIINKKIMKKQQILEIDQQIRNEYNNKFKQIDITIKIELKKRKSNTIIQHNEGIYKNLSPGFQNNHNIYKKVKKNNQKIIIRRWQETCKILKYIQKNQEQGNVSSIYLNIYGQDDSGRTYFIEQLGRILVEREYYQNGVYILQGKKIQKKYHGDFQAYLEAESEIGQVLNLESLENYGNQKLILIIDDFNLIQPKSNGRYKLFMQKLIDKKINIIIVTHEIYRKGTFPFLKTIKMNKMSAFQINVIAHYILNLKDKRVMTDFKRLKSKNNNNLRVCNIIDIQKRHEKKRNPPQNYNTLDLQKLASNFL